MESKNLEKVNDLAKGIDSSKVLARHIIDKDTHLSVRIIQDWLDTVYGSWQRFYGQLGKDILEGHLIGPTPQQAYILTRMRDKGHRVGPIRGFFRWLEGHDRRIHRITMRIMIERGWLRMVDSKVMGLEYIIEPTEAGMIALANCELDREERAYP